MDDAREAYWHEAEPRIIASGRWEQDELGDVTDIPDHVRPSTAEAAEAGEPPVGGDAGPEAPNGVMGDVMGDPTGDTGYRVRSERTWRALTDPALLAALTPATEPDPAAALDADLKAVAEVARDAARLSPDDHAGRRAIEARLAALKTRLDPEGRISDDSDELDSVFSTDPP